ncbi:MAG: metallophosphoesterase family protein [Acidobacteriaceae bacterium]|nr:metallophosphoesterase family protein [Acidobacteriaceae bacterium]
MSNGSVTLLPGLWGHPSGALWIPAMQTAVVADAHLGYSWAQRRRGELGPLADSRTRQKLLTLCDDLAPLRIVFLGDLVHAPRPCAPEREWIEETLRLLSERAELVAVRGNHDREFAREFRSLPVRCVESWSAEGLTAAHGDRFTFAVPEDHTLLLGHLHPCLSVKDASGAGRKLPLFLATTACIILPAFSPFACGYDLVCGIPDELQTCLGNEEVQAFAATGKRIVALGPLHCVVERMFEANVSAPERFRKTRG